MSKARCCDRCGKLYKHYSGNKINKCLQFNTIRLLQKFSDDDYNIKQLFDLCEECSHELESWLCNSKKED